MTWLVTGGAGYIGAHVVRAFAERGLRRGGGRRPLQRAPRASCPTDVPFVEGSILDTGLVAATLREHDVEGVVHVAGLQVRRGLGPAAAAHLRRRTSPARSACSRRWPTPASTRWCSPPAPRRSAPPTSTSSPRRPRRSPESPYGESQADRRVAAARPGDRGSGCGTPRCATSTWSGRATASSTTPARTTCSRWSSRRSLEGRDAADQRRRLRHPGRHLRARLRARRRPRGLPRRRGRARSPAGDAAASRSTTSAAATGCPVAADHGRDGPGHRHRLHARGRARAGRATRPGSWRPASSRPATSTGGCGTPSTTWWPAPGGPARPRTRLTAEPPVPAPKG